MTNVCPRPGDREEGTEEMKLNLKLVVAGKLYFQAKCKQCVLSVEVALRVQEIETYVYHNAFSSLRDFGEGIINGGDIGDD